MKVLLANHMQAAGISLLGLSAVLLCLYIALPYEQYRRLKIKLYRENISQFDDRFKKCDPEMQELIAQATPDMLGHERRTFTFARPAAWCACIGVLLILWSWL